MSEDTNQGAAGQTILVSGPPDPVELTVLKERALAAAAEGIAIADARLPDMPLIYVNSGFERLTGYTADSVLGKNCRFLQGRDTNPAAAAEIRRAIREKRECLVEIVNYRKDGTIFWNRLSITPVRDGLDRVTHFIGIQSDITLQKMAEESRRQAKSELEAVNERMRMELEMAARIQQTMLPPNPQIFEGAELCWLFQPCVELAGDTLNVIPLDDHKIALYVIDVCGHGVASALLSVTLSRWLSSQPGMHCLLPRGSDDPLHLDIVAPAAVAQRLNLQFPMTPEIPQYFTMLFGILDQRNGDFRYVSAGHPAPILIPASGDPSCLPGEGFPVGLLPTADYHEERVRLQPGDRLYLYSDGVPDTRNADEEEFGVERCRSLLYQNRYLPLPGVLDRLMTSLNQWRQGNPMQDDVTMLGVEYRGDPRFTGS